MGAVPLPLVLSAGLMCCSLLRWSCGVGDTSLWCWSISVCSGTNRVWSRVFSCHLFFVSLQSSTGFCPTVPAGGAWCPTDLALTTGKSVESSRLFFTDTMCRCPLQASHQVLIKCEMRGACRVSHSFHQLLIIGDSVKASSGLRSQASVPVQSA